MTLSELKAKIDRMIDDVGDAEVGVTPLFPADKDSYYDFFICCHHCLTNHPLAVINPIHPDYRWDSEREDIVKKTTE